MFLFAATPVAATQHTITIREGDQYSTAFTDLLKDYYLKL